ncbi:methyltransferase-like protein 7A, partial [Centruroides sculpturatus]|uniref:methyltransferase-like protein 7A n=1 Tax=Centruroides sculpturatus TaxID=218467 RepID=UPI000C6ECFF1
IYCSVNIPLSWLLFTYQLFGIFDGEHFSRYSAIFGMQFASRIKNENVKFHETIWESGIESNNWWIIYVNKRFPLRMAKSLHTVHSGLLKLRDVSHHSKQCNEIQAQISFGEGRNQCQQRGDSLSPNPLWVAGEEQTISKKLKTFNNDADYIWYFLTFILLYILLKTSERFSKLWFVIIYEILIKFVVELSFSKIRKCCFRNLKSEVSNDPERSREGRLRILEIGPGGGRNFEYFPEKTSLICVEPNEFCRKFLENNITKYPNIHLEDFYHSGVEDMKEIKDESFDVVVGSCVLCSVQDVEKSLSEIKRVLTKGGKYYYMEHVLDPKPRIYFIQKLVEPFWSLMFHNCQLTRRTGNYVRNAGFSQVIENSIRVPILTYVVQYNLIRYCCKIILLHFLKCIFAI